MIFWILDFGSGRHFERFEGRCVRPQMVDWLDDDDNDSSSLAYISYRII